LIRNSINDRMATWWATDPTILRRCRSLDGLAATL
jgi:hypothetical protein